MLLIFRFFVVVFASAFFPAVLNIMCDGCIHDIIYLALILFFLIFFTLIPQSNRYAFRAYYAIYKRNFQRGIELLTESIKYKPSYGTYNARGVAYLSIWSFEKAADDFNSALELQPRNPSLRVNRALANFHLGMSAEILSDARFLEDMNKKLYTSLLHALADASRKCFDQAVIEFEKMMTKHPRNLHLMILLAIIQHSAGHTEKSITTLTTTIKHHKKKALLYNNRGFYYGCIQDFEAAFADFAYALELKPDLELVYSSRGHTYFLMGEYEKALADFEQSAMMVPQKGFVYAGIAVSYFKLGYANNAQQMWEKTLGLNPTFNDIKLFATTTGVAPEFIAVAEEINTLVYKNSPTLTDLLNSENSTQ